MQITTIGLDLAKSVFQAHGVDAAGQVAIRRKLRRAEVLKFFQTLPACLIGMEACATAHHWAREGAHRLSRKGHFLAESTVYRGREDEQNQHLLTRTFRPKR